jgi:predicted O-methyltransferase YrrM
MSESVEVHTVRSASRLDTVTQFKSRFRAVRTVRRARRIHTFTTRNELKTLHRLASDCPENGRALEIGSYLGASTCYIGAGLRGKDARLVCVDDWQNENMPDGKRDTFAEFMRNVAPVRSRIVAVRKRSAHITADDVGGLVDFAFLDGDHTYLGTKADLELVEPMMTRTGVIAFHDVRFFEGVSRVIGEALASRKWQLEGVANNLAWVRKASFDYSSEQGG